MNGYCEWVYDSNHEYWGSECGDDFAFNCDGPIENGFKFCPFCGEKIKVDEDALADVWY